MTIEERKAYIADQITLWVGKERLYRTLSPEELGRLQMNDKLVVMRNNLIAGSIRHCRLNPRAEAKMPILIMITYMADNAAGVCRLGVMRMAEIFQRTKTCIINNIAALEDDGLIGVERNGGLPSFYWPMVPAALVEMSLNPIYFVEALSAKPKSRFKTLDEVIAAATDDGNRSTVVDQSIAVDRSTVANEPVNCSERTGQLQRDSISSNNSSKEEGGTDVPSPPSHGMHGQQKRASAEGEVMHDVKAAFAAYNEMASKHGLTLCSKLTDDLRRQIGKALHDIVGGLDGFKLAVSAIPANDYLMGLKPGKPVVLNLQRLLNQAGLLDELRDTAAAGKASPTDSVEAEVQSIAASKTGQIMIGDRGREKALQAIRKGVLRRRGGDTNG